MRFGTPALHRNLRIALLLVGAAVMTVFLSQCMLVEDRIASPEMSITAQNGNAGNCISRCARAYADSNRVEAERHVTAMHACDGNESCLDFENIMHTRAKARIAEGRKRCFDECHHQGGGSGGR